jgi:hypothetical protein
VHFKAKNQLTILKNGLQKLKFINPGGVFDGILWNAGNIDAKSKAKRAGLGLCLYLMGQLDKDQEPELIAIIREITKKPDYVLPSRRKDR